MFNVKRLEFVLLTAVIANCTITCAQPLRRPIRTVALHYTGVNQRKASRRVVSC